MTSMHHLVLALACVTMTGVSSSCVSAEDHLAEVIEANKACTEDIQCVLAGSTDCSCGAVVNAAGEDAVNAAADAVSCCDLFGSCIAVECAAFLSLACVDGRCTGQ